MTAKTHRILGLVTGGSYFFYQAEPIYQPATFGAVLVFSYFASLIPDLDRSTAEIWDNIPLGHVAGRVVDPFIKHRNISHSLLGLFISSFLIFLLLRSFPDYWNINHNLVLISFIIAYSSHLLADMFTIEGIPLLYPWKRMFGIPPKPLEGIRIETGKWFENLVLFPILNLAIIIVIVCNFDKIKKILFK